MKICLLWLTKGYKYCLLWSTKGWKYCLPWLTKRWKYCLPWLTKGWKYCLLWLTKGWKYCLPWLTKGWKYCLPWLTKGWKYCLPWLTKGWKYCLIWLTKGWKYCLPLQHQLIVSGMDFSVVDFSWRLYTTLAPKLYTRRLVLRRQHYSCLYVLLTRSCGYIFSPLCVNLKTSEFLELLFYAKPWTEQCSWISE